MAKTVEEQELYLVPLVLAIILISVCALAILPISAEGAQTFWIAGMTVLATFAAYLGTRAIR